MESNPTTMDAKRELEVEDWELLHPNDDDSIVFGGPPLDSILPDHFSLNPNSSCSSNSNSNSSSEVDRNFDDSYVANQIFPNSTLAPWNGDSDSDTTATNAPVVAMAEAEAEAVVEQEEEQKKMEEVEEKDDDEEDEGEEEEEEEEKEKRLVWWKVPFEVLRYWVNPLPLPLPVWSLSVAAAAAFLGLFFLGRRLYRMKRKTQTLKLNLALDDKKVSQLMGRVARLNEAFSVVRRVPIVRPPSLPSSSVTLRPVMSMR
ncbi:hypothetical protein JHK85_009946 [Glycine max]|nr:hypothetical protein JHK87_009560 [Glycine soja]KAG5048843.1 hypothetical protein JHK85_009946 [Glycine max]